MYVWRAIFVATFFLVVLSGTATSQTRRIVCYGDSITAGYGLDPAQAYPAALERMLHAGGLRVEVVNRGTSGATSKDAASGVEQILRMRPDVVLVEFGGNDGLRGLPPEATERNLDQVLSRLASAHVRVLLAGVPLPPNYGPDYIRSFQQCFRRLAARHRTAFVPMLYRELVHTPGTIQPDGLHPTAKGSELIARTLLPALKPLLAK